MERGLSETVAVGSAPRQGIMTTPTGTGVTLAKTNRVGFAKTGIVGPGAFSPVPDAARSRPRVMTIG